MEATFTLGCDENGIFTGLDCEIYFDTGAYASLSGPVLERACTHSVGPYCYQNTDIRGFSYYTNNPPAGAFRGFGVTQSEFALECIHQPPGREGRHLALGDPLPQRHRAGQGPAQRPDSRRLHRAQGVPAGGQGRLRGQRRATRASPAP